MNLLLRFLGPIVMYLQLGVLIACSVLVSVCKGSAREHGIQWGAAVTSVVLFTTFDLVSTSLLMMCLDENQFVLKQIPSISCEDEQFARLQICAVIALLGVAFFYIFCFCSIYVARLQKVFPRPLTSTTIFLKAKYQEQAGQKGLKFFFQFRRFFINYRPDFWYWEFVLFLRKVCVAVVVEFSSTQRSRFATLSLVFGVLGIVNCVLTPFTTESNLNLAQLTIPPTSPAAYISKVQNQLDSVCLLSLFVICGTLLTSAPDSFLVFRSAVAIFTTVVLLGATIIFEVGKKSGKLQALLRKKRAMVPSNTGIGPYADVFEGEAVRAQTENYKMYPEATKTFFQPKTFSIPARKFLERRKVLLQSRQEKTTPPLLPPHMEGIDKIIYSGTRSRSQFGQPRLFYRDTSKVLEQGYRVFVDGYRTAAQQATLAPPVPIRFGVVSTTPDELLVFTEPQEMQHASPVSMGHTSRISRFFKAISRVIWRANSTPHIVSNKPDEVEKQSDSSDSLAGDWFDQVCVSKVNNSVSTELLNNTGTNFGDDYQLSDSKFIVTVGGIEDEADSLLGFSGFVVGDEEVEAIEQLARSYESEDEDALLGMPNLLTNFEVAPAYCVYIDQDPILGMSDLSSVLEDPSLDESDEDFTSYQNFMNQDLGKVLLEDIDRALCT
eukprot:CAMPEP_0175169508 /NCGR_PEP_ID=MMETSP0087-20121206/29635_1 /TAXON_ID=136419 /ORGANISM="Unknown Unknown, Strain D1" /LENGTH=662 /DNA_ID=CAMNT_0016459913 /DNA_START=662 /DNA_END=2651 /DNA_ORIENTATION=-